MRPINRCVTRKIYRAISIEIILFKITVPLEDGKDICGCCPYPDYTERNGITTGEW
jgi:hypothetical protein